MQIPRITLNVWTIITLLILIVTGMVVWHPEGVTPLVDAIKQIFEAIGSLGSAVFG